MLTQTTVTGLEGRGGVLEAIRWRQKSGADVRKPIAHLFLFIGADPNTQWLSGSGVALDAKGFVLTGGDCNESRNPLETSRRGVSPLVTYARARSSASPPPSARARKLSPYCMLLWVRWRASCRSVEALLRFAPWRAGQVGPNRARQRQSLGQLSLTALDPFYFRAAGGAGEFAWRSCDVTSHLGRALMTRHRPNVRFQGDCVAKVTAEKL